MLWLGDWSWSSRLMWYNCPILNTSAYSSYYCSTDSDQTSSTETRKGSDSFDVLPRPSEKNERKFDLFLLSFAHQIQIGEETDRFTADEEETKGKQRTDSLESWLTNIPVLTLNWDNGWRRCFRPFFSPFRNITQQMDETKEKERDTRDRLKVDWERERREEKRNREREAPRSRGGIIVTVLSLEKNAYKSLWNLFFLSSSSSFSLSPLYERREGYVIFLTCETIVTIDSFFSSPLSESMERIVLNVFQNERREERDHFVSLSVIQNDRG